MSSDVDANSGAPGVEVPAGRAIGAMFLFFFGGMWLGLWAVLQFERVFTPLTLVAACTLALFSLAYRRYHVYRPALQAGPTSPERRRIARKFNIVNAAQWILIFIACIILQSVGLAAWEIPAIMFIVGVHFLPLAAIFSNRYNHVTAGAMIATAVIYPFLTPGGPQDPSGPLIAGIILWSSAYISLRRARPPSGDADHN